MRVNLQYQGAVMATDLDSQRTKESRFFLLLLDTDENFVFLITGAQRNFLDSDTVNFYPVIGLIVPVLGGEKNSKFSFLTYFGVFFCILR